MQPDIPSRQTSRLPGRQIDENNKLLTLVFVENAFRNFVCHMLQKEVGTVSFLRFEIFSHRLFLAEIF